MKYPIIRELIIKPFHGGLLPIKISSDAEIILIIKAPKEFLLTAKYNKGFKIYTPALTIESQKTTSIISAFFDSSDDPLTIVTPLLDEKQTKLYQELLLQEQVDIYLFTETDTELLGYSAKIQCPDKTNHIIKNSSFLPSEIINALNISSKISEWFINRTEEDEAGAISINFEDSLYPEDLIILDTTQSKKIHATDLGMYTTLLERKEPGSYQEAEISHFFSRIFDASKIFMNPKRPEDGEEIADLIITGKNYIIFVQAKDSPNTENTIRKTIDRKKATTLKHLTKALRQISGAIKYSTKSPTLIFSSSDLYNRNTHDFTINTTGLDIYGLIVIKELFIDDYKKYSDATLKVCDEVGHPCIVLDFFELHKHTMSLKNEDDFMRAYNFIYTTGRGSGCFPRVQIIPERPEENRDD